MRKRVMVLSMVLMLVAAACSDDDDDDGAATPDTGAETEEPVRGGTLVVAVTSDPGGLNPAITTSGATHTVAELMFNGLVSIDEELQPSGELAESWDVEENGAVYRFTLRDGVTWHDGTPFTSADVKYTFDEMLLKLHGRARASIGPALAGIETPDARTVVFRFKAPYAPLL
jgi:peptide/nickel transport system substrate-binding protein